MLKKTITYTDYDGVERTEDFYFNLNKAELAEMELSEAGGLSKNIELMISELDAKKIAEFFKFLILKSHGVKTMDGKRFMKSKEISDDFEATEAYSDLYIGLINNSEDAAAFVQGIIPKA